MGSKHTQLQLILLLLAYYCSTHIDANNGNGITVKCLPDQALSLLQLKRSFFHNPNLSSWQHGTDCCHWEGVGCDRASGQVITLYLSDRNLQSRSGLSPALFNLTSLTNLSLAGNDFGNTILPNFGFEQLTNLLSLDLSNARLFGQIPIGVAHLKNLRTLDLSYNNMYLQEPSFQALVADLSSLRELYLDTVGILSNEATWSVGLADSVPLLQDITLFRCGLSGPIHHSFSRLRFLAKINLRECGISGHVPRFFAEFSFLRDLDLSGNNFEGEFPIKIFLLENLRYLDVSSNPSLSVQLPDFPRGNNLKSLNLQDTNLSSAIPDSFVHLKSLEFLGLSNIGSPEQPTTSIANLTSLNRLWLSGSGIEKPTFSWIGGLTNLTDLMLEDYNFSGPIHWWIRNCTSLTGLSLFSCSLSGAIPLWIGNLTKLSDLELSNNSLNGKIPKSLFTLPALRGLYLDSNQFSGPLEEVPAPSSSPLRAIWLPSNELTGPIPKSFFELQHLEGLNLALNKLSGRVQLSSFWRLKSISWLSLSNNMLSIVDEAADNVLPSLPNIEHLFLASCNLTKLPSVLRYLDKISDLDLSNNQINGVIPWWVWENWKDQLEILDISRNMFTALEKSSSLVYLPHLTFLDLSFNRLQGSVPIPVTSYVSSPYFLYYGAFLDYSNNYFSSMLPNFGRYIENAIYLDLSKNKLDGHIPSSVCSARKLIIMDLSYNNLSGSIPPCLVETGELRVLKLRENRFHGILPENIREGCKFETLDFNGNRLEGKLPRSLSNCQDLELLDVGNNQIVDSFPSWLGALPQLRVLILRSNQLSGTIKDIKGDHRITSCFRSLQVLDLASNSFSGKLQKGWFNELKAMMAIINGEGQVIGHQTNLPNGFYRDIVTITFKGFGLTFSKVLTTLKVIDFSNNSFDGPIPESIGKLVSLHGLNMSYNNFTGQIPHQLSKLNQLESLDLSWNQLSGEIPQALTSLTSLEWLNLSYNSLSGRIPQGNQFLTFSNNSFEGNMGLCGLPLSKQCDSPASLAPNTASPPESNSLCEDKLGVILLFAFVGLGFGVGFALSFLLRLFCRTRMVRKP